MKSKRNWIVASASSIATLAIVTTPANGQEQGGLTSRFSVQQAIEVTSNPTLIPDNTDTRTFTSTDLGYVLNSRTRSSEFEFSAAGQIRYVIDGSETSTDGLTFGDETLGLSYTKEVLRSQFSVSADYDRDDLSFFDTVSLIDTDDTTLADDFGDVAGSGSRENLRYRLDYQNDARGPFGWGTTLSGSKLNYNNVTSTSLVDSDVLNGSVNAHLKINPNFQITTRLGYVQRDTETTDQSSTVDFRLGVTAERADNLAVRGNLSYSAPENNDDRFSISAGFTMTPSERSSLSFDAGATISDGFGTRFMGSLEYEVQRTKTASFSVRLNTEVTDSIDDEVVVDTAAILGADFELNPVTSMSFNVSYAQESEVDTDIDQSQVSTSLQLNRQLTNDWQMQVGASYINSMESGLEDASSGAIFFNVGRDWVARH